MSTATRPVGDLLRDWRLRRRLSQLELATEVEISTRHLSFMETGRSQASRAMVLRLAERLEIPLRERNDLLIAAGFFFNGADDEDEAPSKKTADDDDSAAISLGWLVHGFLSLKARLRRRCIGARA